LNLVEERDTLGIYSLTIGNIGYSKLDISQDSSLPYCSSSSFDPSVANTSSTLDLTELCVPFLGGEMSALSATYLISALEFIMAILGILGLAVLSHNINHVVDSADKNTVTCEVKILLKQILYH